MKLYSTDLTGKHLQFIEKIENYKKGNKKFSNDTLELSQQAKTIALGL